MLSFALLLLFSACWEEKDKSESSSSSQESSSSSSSSQTEASSKDPESQDSSSSQTSQSESSSESIATAEAVSGAEKKDFSQLSGLSEKLIGWGPGTERDENGQIVGAVRAQSQYGKYNALFIGKNEKRLILTFDEGYENGYTEKILDTLKEKNVKAVFFVTGDYVEREAELVERIISEGHVVGNHSVNHYSLPTISLEEAEKEIMELHEQVEEQFHYTMTLFRPPKGEYSEKTLMLAKTLGYQNIFWSFAYKDWEVDNQMGVSAAFEKMCNGLHPGAVYLLHAVSSDNAALLGDWIDYVQKQGYEFTLPSADFVPEL